MLKNGSAARKVYDKLRASSKGICPLCGIHGVDTLDHYLPKARYPLFSVNPKILYQLARNVIALSLIVYVKLHQTRHFILIMKIQNFIKLIGLLLL